MFNYKNISQVTLVMAVLVLFIGSSSGISMSTGMARSNALVPAYFKTQDPSGSFVLSPGWYTYISIQMETGMNATFQVYSNTILDVYFMTSSQFANFQSAGSTQSVYNFEGTSATASLGPFSSGTYYLVIDNDVSSQNAGVSYNLSTMPVNIYSFYQSLPAPVGITDYGVLNASGMLHPYKILYNEAIGMAQINSLQAYNSSPPAGISPYGVSLQQNVVLQVNTTKGNYEYWLQNVPSFWTNNDTIYFSDNIWNDSASASSLTSQAVTGKGGFSFAWVPSYIGGIIVKNSVSYYNYETSLQQYNLPLTLYLITQTTRSNNAAYVSFGYALSPTFPITWYDNVTIYGNGITAASLVVSGYNTIPTGNLYDSELVFGGEGSSEQTQFTQMNATLFMRYILPNGSEISPPALYGFGSNTAEAADDLLTVLVNGYPSVELGSGNFGSVWYSKQSPTFSAELTLNTSAVDSGTKVPITLNSFVKNGLSPYTYYFYIDGKAVYNFTTLNAQLSKTVYLPPLKSGTYQLQVAVFDSAGHSAYSSTYSITMISTSYNYVIIGGLVVIIAIVIAAAVIGIVLALRRRGNRKGPITQQPENGPAPSPVGVAIHEAREIGTQYERKVYYKGMKYEYSEYMTYYKLTALKTLKTRAINALLLIFGFFMAFIFGLTLPFSYSSGGGVFFVTAVLFAIGVLILWRGIKRTKLKKVTIYYKNEFTKQEDESTITLLRGEEKIVLAKLT